MTVSNFINKVAMLLSCVLCANFSHATINVNQQQDKESQPKSQMQWNKYVQTGFILLTPSIGVGLRGDNNSHGFDVALDFATPLRPSLLTVLKLNVNYLKFFKLKEKSRWYFGPGVSYSYMHIDFNHKRYGHLKGDLGIIFPIQLTLRREKLHKSGEKIFFQAQVASFGYVHNENRWTPGVFSTLTTYGWLF